MNGKRVAATLVLAVSLASGAWARAQMGDPTQDGADAAAFAMGSGRMVRGTVTAISADRITLKNETGEIFQIALSPNTRLMKDRQPVRASDVRVGDGIGAGGEMDPATRTLHALFVSVVDAEQVKKMRDSFGKTWIQGRITAIDELKLTILRGDKVTQVIVVDEDTSFKRGGRGLAMAMQADGGGPSIGGAPSSNGDPGRAHAGSNPNAGGESITLADVKVGDIVAGEGAVKKGVFMPTTLAVVNPSERRRRAGNGVPEPK